MAYVSQWGGMDLKEGMLFAGNVVDGLVHELGGWPLRIQCMLQPEVAVGQAVRTGPGGSRLRQEYNQIVHTVPPFYNHDKAPERLLAECYRNSLRLACSDADGPLPLRVACPLIGAGARAFPLDVAIQIAASESIRWREGNSCKDATLAFGIPNETTANSLIAAIEQQEKSHAAIEQQEKVA